MDDSRSGGGDTLGLQCSSGGGDTLGLQCSSGGGDTLGIQCSNGGGDTLGLQCSSGGGDTPGLQSPCAVRDSAVHAGQAVLVVDVTPDWTVTRPGDSLGPALLVVDVTADCTVTRPGAWVSHRGQTWGARDILGHCHPDTQPGLRLNCASIVM